VLLLYHRCSTLVARCVLCVILGRILTIETVPLKLARKLWAGPDHLNPDQTYFPDEYLHHVLYITRIYFIYGATQNELIGLFLLLFYYMRCGLLLQMSHVAWSVCLSVTRMCCAKRLNRSRCCWGGAETCDTKEPCIRWGRDPPREGAIFRVIWPIVKHWDFYCGVCSKMSHSILNNGMTAWLLQPTVMLQTGRCHITLSLVKNPSAMRPFVKIIWPLVSYSLFLTFWFCRNFLLRPYNCLSVSQNLLHI